MTRLFCFTMVFVAVGMLTASAWASIPYAPYSTVVWNKASFGDDSVVVVCPKGDASYFDVTVKDQFNAPMAGVTVKVSVFPDATVPPRLVFCGVLTGLTNASGYCRVGIKAGCNYTTAPIPYDPGAAAFLAGGVVVDCLSVVLFSDLSLKYYISPDSNASKKVMADDGTLFTNDWQRVLHNCHSNYNRTGLGTENVTNSADGTVFSQHWQHECP